VVKKYVENNTPNTIYVGGLMIAPGEGREVDVPGESAKPVLEDLPDPDGALRELLVGNVASVAAALDGLGESALMRLRELESDMIKPRKGVLEALDVAAIALASKALDLKSDPL
jgi:hypothetical protein